MLGSAGRLAMSDTLQGALAVTVVRSCYMLKLVNIDTLEIVNSHRPRMAEYVMFNPFVKYLTPSRRILKISNHKDVVEITSPKGGIVNIAVADPEKLMMRGSFICSKKRKTFVVASLVGVTTRFYNDGSGSSHICVRPFYHSWPRFTAVVKQVLGANTLYFRSCSGGIVFGTGSDDSHGPAVIHGKSTVCAPIRSAKLPVHEKSTSFRSLPLLC